MRDFKGMEKLLEQETGKRLAWASALNLTLNLTPDQVRACRRIEGRIKVRIKGVGLPHVVPVLYATVIRCLQIPA